MAGKTEYKLEFSPYNHQTVGLDPFYSQMRQIQSLLLSKKFLVDSEAGIDIHSYLMEIADEQTLIDIRKKVIEKIKRYLPTINLKDIKIEYASDANGRFNKSLIIGVALSKSTGEIMTGVVTFASNKKSNQLLSKIIV